MQRYFVDQKNVAPDRQEIIIVGDDVAHITKVMRSTVGTRFICCDEQGSCYVCKVEGMEKDKVICRMEEQLLESRELPIKITIAQGLPKGDKMEMVIQKGTELGAHVFVPFTSSRTVVQLDAKKEQKRVERWSKIAKEAAEQSHRQFVPSIQPLHSWKQLLNLAKEYDVALLAYENEQAGTLHEAFGRLQAGSRVLLAIGPEGGFSELEVREAMEYGFLSVSLGKRILRTETAALYGLSCISYYYEQLGGR
ncbi:16S rRNA (uracil(1498)-N(3))-methyltransferase [Ammoniphilus sp. CFH 90114]|uniref:16S rRNA (uracil(1498)-N(3))-methyltransferase n=1 Tax=Ammoniphilus sp. CFH 90114 TaxID=2493665 RepID=UPI00100F9F64|nr:16S rRNA (uracil(1498)-N(3))-methyltransferase [Ammoniphilus sp. CFH 90114]RXT14815.1 16S rRNA (uracil(1498)-N(3))-methyltransferase [Ammoniphilus sp. CFH 90114]